MTEPRDEHFRSRAPWVWALVVVALGGIMLYLFYGLPQANLGPRQPISFSHRVHAGVKEINCRFCHPFVGRSQRAGIPDLQKCFFCHKYVIPLHPEIQKEKRRYEDGVPVKWVRAFYVPDFVKFKHQTHIQFGKLDCSACHGAVETMDRLPSVEFQMGFCIGCHREKKAQIDCWLACHH
jgi:predicted CXXCH cytochrome family protein